MSASIKEIAALAGCAGNVDDTVITDLSADSRQIVKPASTLFVALESPNNDGHLFIDGLIKKGCRSFIVDRKHAGDYDPALNVIAVDDPAKAMGDIGAACRRKSGAVVVAVTGSRGKTTVKEMIFQALHDRVKTARSPRSYNSRIGVPLSLWEIASDTRLAVIEAGISQKGEMDRLEEIIAPDIVIFTGVTDEHDDGFASRKEKIAEKLKLARRAKALIYNADDPETVEAVDGLGPIEKIAVNGMRGDALHDNLLLVGALLSHSGYTPGEIKEITARCYAVGTRLQVIEGVNDCKLIMDLFTPDTVSLRSALDFMRRRSPESNRLTLLLATDSFIGDSQSLSELTALYGISRVIETGSRHILPGAEHFASVEELTDRLKATDFVGETILMSGRPDDRLDTVFSMLEAKQHETVMEVNLDAVISNFNFFRSKVSRSTGMICMLKAHGYGAGSVELARTLQSQGAAYIAVAVVDEGVELRRAGITMPIIVLNPRAQNHYTMFQYRLEPEIYSFDMLEDVISNARRYGISGFPVHLKMETGMRRLGFMENETRQLGRRLAEVTEVRAASVFSHLACADDPAEDDYTHRQFEIFDRCCDNLDALLPEKPKRHILNSTGIIRFPEKQYDFVRLGIGLYGVATLADGSMAALKNVSTLSSVIISIKHWKAGDTIGYNRRGVLSRDSVIATVPIGYADGLDRHLGNGHMEMVVNGTRCKTVGSICMDICMIDVTDARCAVGDRVEIFGDTVTPAMIADTLGTIPYEILTSISPRVKRVYYRE